MNRKYIDFVPAGGKKKVAARASQKRSLKESVSGGLVDSGVKEVSKLAEVKKQASVVAGPKTAKVVNYQQKFVQTEVKKRPLGTEVNTEALKAKKVVRASVNSKKPLKPSFVNTEKVKKRPLSKNVYHKERVTAEEPLSGPVTIIDKPEKDSKVGLVITIIITIILGAAAGTVAFLLLPK